MAEPQ